MILDSLNQYTIFVMGLHHFHFRAEPERTYQYHSFRMMDLGVRSDPGYPLDLVDLVDPFYLPCPLDQVILGNQVDHVIPEGLHMIYHLRFCRY